MIVESEGKVTIGQEGLLEVVSPLIHYITVVQTVVRVVRKVIGNGTFWGAVYLRTTEAPKCHDEKIN